LIITCPPKISSRPTRRNTTPNGPKEQVTEINAGDFEGWQEGDTEVGFFTGHVHVRKGEFEIKAARAMTWKRPGSRNPFDEIYAGTDLP
jgi:lipopolysaccharide export system protein LptA